MSAGEERLAAEDLTDEPDAEAGAADDAAGPLLPNEDGAGYQMRWREIQVRFVDEPRRAVEAADGLVAELMERLSSSFAQERERLETEWERGDQVSTEDLRRAIQHYRSFFNRLLAA